MKHNEQVWIDAIRQGTIEIFGEIYEAYVDEIE